MFKSLGSYLDNAKIYSNWVIQTTEIRPWMDPNDRNKRLGTRVTVAIIQDNLDYPPRADGSKVSNIFEKFVVKIAKPVDVPVGAIVQLVNPKGKIYGNFCGELSTTADDIKVVQTSNKS